MITDEMVELAIAAGTPEVSATRYSIYEEFDLRAAIAAVLPLIRNAALEEAARLCDKRVSRLKELVKEAFEEGFSDGCEEGQELGEFVGNGGDAERHKGRSSESYWKNSYTHTKLGDTQ